jgi:YhcH/YjgK/YiaL family protein
MIYDTINNITIYKQVIPQYAMVLDFVSKVLDNKIDLTKNRIEIDGDKVFALVNRYETKESGLWEAHKKYIDIQWMLNGRESILFAHLKDLKITKDYDVKNDYLLLEGDGDNLTLSKGEFAIFFPDDAHQPGLTINKPEAILKIVIKVRLSE